MVLGRTSFQKSLDSLVIPLRKSISVDGKTIDAVMTAGLCLDSAIVFENNAHAGSYNTLTLLRQDKYRQFFSSDIESLDAYLKPVDSELLQRVSTNFSEQVSATVQEAKTGKETYSFFVSNKKFNSILSAKYLPDYKLWVVGRTDFAHVDTVFIEEFGILFIIFIFIFIFIFIQCGFYILVKSIAKNEQRTRSQLIYQANHDPLTTLPNRLYMRKNIDNWWQVSQSNSHCCSSISITLNASTIRMGMILVTRFLNK